MRGHRRNNWVQIILLSQFSVKAVLSLLLLLFSNVLFAAASTNADEAHRILVLHSYHQGLTWTDGIQEGISRSLANTDDYEIHVEYLDTKRYRIADLEEPIVALLRTKYDDIPPDVVVVSDNDALELVKRHRSELFPQTPIVFCGINNYREDLIDDSGWYTGVVEKTDAAATFDLLRSLRPGLSRCIVITDQTTTGMAELAAAQKALGGGRDGVSVDYWINPEMSALCKQVSELDPISDAVLLLVVNRDASGRYYSYEAGGRLISEASSAPVFGLWDFYLGTGLLGGHMASAADQGRLVGDITKDLCAGASPQGTGITLHSPNRSYVDHAVMARFSITDNQLPENVTLVNKPVTLWETHKRAVLTVSGIMLTEAIAMVLLGLFLLHHKHKSTRELRDSEEHYRSLVEASPNCIWLFDTQGRFLSINQIGINVMGWEPDDIIGRRFPEVWPIEARPLIEQAVTRVLQGEQTSFEADIVCSDGSHVTWYVILNPVANSATGNVQRFVSIAIDITERKKAEIELRKLSQVVEQAAAAIVITDKEGTIEFVNPAFTKNTGYSSEEVVGKNPRVLQSGEMHASAYKELWDTLTKGGIWRGELHNRRKDGSLFWELATIAPVLDGHGQFIKYAAVKEDITDRKDMEKKLRIAANHDNLTGLANRANLCAHLDEALEHTQRDPSHRIAILFLDFDRFKIINDSLGHDVGDLLLKEIANRLRETFEGKEKDDSHASNQVIARFGGDEFVVLLDGITGPDAALFAADCILTSLASPYILDGREINSTASIGIRVSNASGCDHAVDMLRDADTAMYESKIKNRGCCTMFNDSMLERVQRQLKLENDLRKAIVNNEMFLMYQPVVCLQQGTVVSYEALARWEHPELGLINPDEFIPIAEDTGIIHEIGHWVLHTACQQFMDWCIVMGENAPTHINVNLSHMQLVNLSLTKELQEILNEVGMPADALCLEVTESAVMQDVELAATMLAKIKSIGIRLAIDDFGVGHSSFASLQALPFDVLKIDKSFVTGLERNRSFAAMVHAVTDLANNMNIQIVAEGVENADQVAMLQAIECNYGQGFLFSKPLPASKVPGFKVRNELLKPNADAA